MTQAYRLEQVIPSGHDLFEGKTYVEIWYYPKSTHPFEVMTTVNGVRDFSKSHQLLDDAVQHSRILIERMRK